MRDGKVSVRVTGTSFPVGAQEEESVLLAEGSLRRGLGAVALRYTSLSTEEIQESASLLVAEEAAYLTRRGETSADFTFLPGKRTALTYETPYGQLEFLVETEGVAVTEQEDSLTVEIRYTLLADNAEVSKHQLQILIQTA